MDTEHKFYIGQRVYVRNYTHPESQDAIGTVKNFFGNKIYTVDVAGKHDWAYEWEMREIPLKELLKLSIEHAKR